MKKLLEDSLKAIAALDLEPIKIKLLLGEGEQGWEAEKIRLTEANYRKFLILNAKYPEKQIVPSKDVDAFWHAHILDTMKYAEDCQTIFGEPLHHFPYFGMRGTEDAANLQTAFTETQHLHKEEFGEALLGKAGDCDAEQCSPAECHNRSPVEKIRPTFASLGLQPI